MFPILIEYQIKRALQEYAEDVALPDTVKKELTIRILEQLYLVIQQEKALPQNERALSISLAPNLVNAIILSECKGGHFLTVRQESGDGLIKFKIDTFRKVNITFS